KSIPVSDVKQFINHLTAATPLTRVNQVMQTVHLQPVSKTELTHDLKAVQQLHAVSQQRRQVEAKLRAQGPPPTKPTDPPRTAKPQRLTPQPWPKPDEHHVPPPEKKKPPKQEVKAPLPNSEGMPLQLTVRPLGPPRAEARPGQFSMPPSPDRRDYRSKRRVVR